MALSARYAAFHGASFGFTMEESELPDLHEGELLVKVSYTSLCRSDVNTYAGKRRENTPTILGHESIGVIERIAPGVNRDARGVPLWIGQRITWGIYASDPSDPMSLKGIPQKASDLFKYGHEVVSANRSFHGGLSEYIVLRRNTPVVALVDSLSDRSASLINCSVATVAAAFRLAGDIRGRSLMVTGTGMLGVIACAMAGYKEARTVCAVDVDSKRLATAMAFGATEALPFGELRRSVTKPDVVMDFSGTNEAMAEGIAVLSTGGTAVWIGATFPQEPLRISAEDLVRRLITVKGLHNYNEEDLLEAVRFMESTDAIHGFSSFVERDFTLEQTEEAFRYAMVRNPYRVGINFKIDG